MKKQKKSNSKNKPLNKPNSINTKESKDIETNRNVYAIRQSEDLGRYLVAAKNISAGEIIMTEEPILVGPCQEAKPLCIGCYVNINLEDSSSSERCSGCGWPLCTSSCSGYHQKYGHGTLECEILSKSLIKEKDIQSFSDFFYAVTPFRCLVIKQSNPEHWKILQSMESHTKERKKATKLWEANTKSAVEVIRKVWGLSEFTEDEIHFVCGILEVNAFEVNLPTPGSQCLRAVYPSAFLFAHDCVPNTCHSNGEDFHLIVRTMRAIPVGGMITVSYTYTLQSTLKRRKHLQQTKFFFCHCKRCSDPTELGTYAGAVRCIACKEGLMLPVTSLKDDSDWKCKKCKSEVHVSQIIPILDRLFEELDGINGNDVESYEKFLEKSEVLLNENHCLSLSALHCLSQLYGKINGYLINDLSEEQLERKEEICRRLIRVFDKLEPGLSKHRGILLYELQAPLMVRLRKRFQSQSVTKKEMKSKIKEVLKYLEEASLILSKEPKNSTEGQMAEAAKEGISSLKDWLHLLN